MQTSYSTSRAAAVEGMVADGSPHTEIKSFIAETAIPFGRAVNITTAASATAPVAKISLCDATGDLTGVSFVGFSIADTSRPYAAGGYAIGDLVPVLTKGDIWLRPEDAITSPAAVWGRFTANGAGKTVGQVRSDIDTDKAVAVPGARFMTSCGAVELSRVAFAYQD